MDAATRVLPSPKPQPNQAPPQTGGATSVRASTGSTFSLEDVRHVLDMTIEAVEPWSGAWTRAAERACKDPDWLVHTSNGVYATALASSLLICQSLPQILHSFKLSWHWWTVYLLLVWVFYQYLRPVVRGTLGSISFNSFNFHTVVTLWLFAAMVVHLPRFKQLGIHVEADVGLFLSIFLGTLLVLSFVHSAHRLLAAVHLLPYPTSTRRSMVVFSVLVNSFNISSGCCLFYSFCGDDAALQAAEHPLKKALCHRLSVDDFPAYRHWVLYNTYEEFVRNHDNHTVFEAAAYPAGNALSRERFIAPLFSLWTTFICMSVANSVAEACAHIKGAAAEAGTRSSERRTVADKDLGATSPPATRPAEAPVGGQVEIERAPSSSPLQHLNFEWNPKDEEDMHSEDFEAKPDFLPMVPWYSGTTTEILNTAIDLLVSLKIFQGRFDMRSLQYVSSLAERANRAGGDGLTFDHLARRSGVWMDFMADTGDGGDSTYAVARLLAQPALSVPTSPAASAKWSWDARASANAFAGTPYSREDMPRYLSARATASQKLEVLLPRADVCVIGGDLAYPTPSIETYNTRLFAPFEAALPRPKWYNHNAVAVQKPELPPGVASLGDYTGPQCFAIPGNHDWFDGLDTFLRKICYKSWIGGWLMPQQHSFFALKLPHSWWVFGMDLALHEDIDVHQLKYFAHVTSERVKLTDSVILVTHQPVWLLDWLVGEEEKRKDSNLACLVRDHIGSRARVWLAGDIHHYMRHSKLPRKSLGASESSHPKHRYHHNKTDTSFPEHLIVCGGGGAFLHPTHCFQDFSKFGTGEYACESAFPSYQTSRMIGACLLPLFRQRNWRFDVIGGLMYFLLAVSAFPTCGVLDYFDGATALENLQRVPAAFSHVICKMFAEAYVSLGTALFFALLSIGFAGSPASLSPPLRIVLGGVHALAHWTAALALMLMMELALDLCTHHGFLGKDVGVGSTYFQPQEAKVADPNGLHQLLEAWTSGIYPAVPRSMYAVFDVPELMAVTRRTVCTSGWDSLSRSSAVLYYMASFLYFWVLCTPVVSWIFGCYLYYCVNWLHIHYDEAFSALRIPHYKSFLRTHIDASGALEIFTIGLRKIPRKWATNRGDVHINPSKWVPADGQPGSVGSKSCGAEVVDYIRIEKVSSKY